MLCSVGTYKIPTWTTPLFLSFVVSVLLSNTSFLGHICAIVVGYLRKWPRFFYHSIIHHPADECAPSRTRIPSSLLPTREAHSLDRRKIESSWSTAALRVGRPEDARPVRHSPNNLDGRADGSHELYWVLATVRTMKASKPSM